MSIKSQYEALPSQDKDRFIEMMNRLIQDSVSRSIVVDEEHSKVKNAVDRANKKRERLTSDLDTTNDIAGKMKAGAGNSLETQLMVAMLEENALDLRAQIDKMRPTKDLERKHELKTVRDRLCRHRTVAELVLELISSEQPDGQ